MTATLWRLGIKDSEPDGEATVLRRRCLAEIQNQNRHICWISAPAGTGKSQLLRQIAKHYAGPTAVVDINGGECDPGQFFQTLAGAVANLDGTGEPVTFGQVDLAYPKAFATGLLSRIDTSAGQRPLLVIDDIHHLKTAPELIDALAVALSKSSERLCFAIASREGLPASWAGVLAAGQILQLGLDQLLLDEEEIRRLLETHPAWRQGSSGDIVAGVWKATRGWASGIGVLIALSASRVKAKSSFCAHEARERVFDAFADLIFASFSPAEQKQILLAAISPVLDQEVLRDLVGEDICLLLERLRRHNTMVSQDYSGGGSARTRYRMHDLLRDYLCHEGRKRLSSHDRRGFASKMAARLLAVGEGEAARVLFVEAKDWEALSKHLEETAADLFETGRLRTLARYLSVLPESVRRRKPSLCYWFGVSTLPLDPWAARESLVFAYECLSAGGGSATERIRAWVAAVEAIWYEWDDCGRLDPFIADLPEMRCLVRAAGCAELERLLVKSAFTALAMRCPEHPEFEALERQNLDFFLRRLPRAEAVQVGPQLLLHYVYGSGERCKAQLVVDRLRQLYDPESESIAEHCSYYIVNAAHQFWFSPDASRAQATVMTGLAITEKFKVPFWEVPLINPALFRSAADGQIENLRNLLGLLSERLTPDSREHDLAIHHHFSAYLAWLEGDHETALISIEMACRIAEDSGYSLSPLYYGIGYAAVLASLGRRRDALRRLRQVRQTAEARHCAPVLFMSYMLGAALAMDEGKEGIALLRLRYALDTTKGREFRTVPWLPLGCRNRLCDLAQENGLDADLLKGLRTDQRESPAAPGLIQICTLGRVDILRNARSELSSRKPQVMPLRLLLHLVAAGPKGLPGDQLIDALWPEAETRAGRQRLKTTLYRLRTLLGDQASICAKGGRLQFDPSRLRIDAWQLEDLLVVEMDPVEAAGRALEIYQGEFVDLCTGHYELTVYRSHLLQRVEAAVLGAGRVLIDQCEWHKAEGLLEIGLQRLGAHADLLNLFRLCLEKQGRIEAMSRLAAFQFER